MKTTKDITFHGQFIIYTYYNQGSVIKLTTTKSKIAEHFDENIGLFFEKSSCKSRNELKRFNLTSLKSIKKGVNIAILGDCLDTVIEVKGSLGLIKNIAECWSIYQYITSITGDIIQNVTNNVADNNTDNVSDNVADNITEDESLVFPNLNRFFNTVKAIALIKVW